MSTIHLTKSDNNDDVKMGGYRSSNTLNFLAGFHLSQNSRLIFTYNKSIDNVIFPDTYCFNFLFWKWF